MKNVCEHEEQRHNRNWVQPSGKEILDPGCRKRGRKRVSCSQGMKVRGLWEGREKEEKTRLPLQSQKAELTFLLGERIQTVQKCISRYTLVRNKQMCKLFLFPRDIEGFSTTPSPLFILMKIPGELWFLYWPTGLSDPRKDIPGETFLCAMMGGRIMATFPENQRTFIYIWNEREKTPSFHLSVMFQSIHPLTVTAKLSFDKNSSLR